MARKKKVTHPFPWEIRPCKGGAIQFMVIDANEDLVSIGEVFSVDALRVFLEAFKENPEIRVAKDFEKQIEWWKEIHEAREPHELREIRGVRKTSVEYLFEN